MIWVLLVLLVVLWAYEHHRGYTAQFLLDLRLTHTLTLNSLHDMERVIRTNLLPEAPPPKVQPTHPKAMVITPGSSLLVH